MRIWEVLAVLLAVPAVAAEPDHPRWSFETGNVLHRDCIESKSGYCLGYIIGATDAFLGIGMVCVPQTATQGQIRDVVTKYLEDHPETRHFRADSIVFTALQAAWPCAAGK